jgi:signal peptidase I
MTGDRSRLVRWGMIAAFGTVLVPLLWLPALVLAILVLVRTDYQKEGAIILVLGVFLLPVVGAVLWQAYFLKPYRAPSESMLPNVKLGDRFVVFRPGYEPKVGDVAVLHAPAGAQLDDQCGAPPEEGAMCAQPTPERSEYKFVKRIVAGPGDRVRMEKGRVIRNGKKESGYRLAPCRGAECDFPKEITIPDGLWFVLGDNRGASDDSRFWGPVPAEDFIGRRIFTYWKG